MLNQGFFAALLTVTTVTTTIALNTFSYAIPGGQEVCDPY